MDENPPADSENETPTAPSAPESDSEDQGEQVPVTVNPSSEPSEDAPVAPEAPSELETDPEPETPVEPAPEVPSEPAEPSVTSAPLPPPNVGSLSASPVDVKNALSDIHDKVSALRRELAIGPVAVYHDVQEAIASLDQVKNWLAVKAGKYDPALGKDLLNK